MTFHLLPCSFTRIPTKLTQQRRNDPLARACWYRKISCLQRFHRFITASRFGQFLPWNLAVRLRNFRWGLHRKANISIFIQDFVTWNKYADRDKSHSFEVDVEEIFYHKKKDLALIKLKESVTFTETIRPACLPLSDNYNFKELQSHLCKRSHNKSPADVTLEFAVNLHSH